MTKGLELKPAFVKKPGNQEDKRMKNSLKLEPIEELKNEDMQEIWPDWTPELYSANVFKLLNKFVC